jgi:isopentenyl diphosphate isomerase/L-lactate dehydrogenase-like FMN-dependent dehydrogenase
VVDAVKGKCRIVVDGGFYRGTDIVKAIALGADAVGMGRLQGLALAAGGQAALVMALELLEDETRRVLGLLGVTGFGQLDRSYLAPGIPLARYGIDSPFPLLKEGY